MRYRLSDLCGTGVLRDAGFDRTGFATTAGAGLLCPAAAPKYLRHALANPDVTAVIVPPALQDDVPDPLGVLVDEAPQRAFYDLHNSLVHQHGLGQLAAPARHASARIHPTAIVGDNVVLGADVTIGAGAIVDNAILEDGVVVDAGALIGVDGHFFKDFGDTRLKVAHGGLAILRAGVQVLAGAVVQRGVFDDGADIGADTVISTQVLVAHGVRIGPRCVLAGGAQIAGFTTLGREVWIGPGAVISNLLEIGDKARIEIGAVVIKSVPAGERQSGAFAAKHARNLQFHAPMWRVSDRDHRS